MMKKIVLAIDFGGTNIRIATIDRAGNLLKKVSKNYNSEKMSGEEISRLVFDSIKEFFDEYATGEISGIGISAAGFIDYEKGIVTTPNSFMKSVSLVGPLEQEFNLPVILHNDCNSAVLGEQMFGLDKEKKNLVYLTISSGIGSGVVIDGKLAFGKTGNFGEVGHFAIESEYNFPCGCAMGLGHWEACASGKNIPRFFSAWAEKNGITIDFGYTCSEDIFNKAKDGNVVALDFMNTLGAINARGISNVIMAYDPEIILLSGSVVTKNEDMFLKHLESNVNKKISLPEIKVSSLGDDAPILGAAAAVFSALAIV